jgi:hypothetical protein
MSEQLEILFNTGPRERDRVFSLDDDERSFLESCREKWVVPESFLATVRLKRRGWSRGFWSGLLSYERSRELADELAVIFLPETECRRAYDPDPMLIDYLAKREAAERSEAFEKFMAERRAA